MTNDRITGPCPECERLRDKLQAAEDENARLRKVMRKVAQTTSDPDVTDAIDSALEVGK